MENVFDHIADDMFWILEYFRDRGQRYAKLRYNQVPKEYYSRYMEDQSKHNTKILGYLHDVIEISNQRALDKEEIDLVCGLIKNTEFKALDPEKVTHYDCAYYDGRPQEGEHGPEDYVLLPEAKEIFTIGEKITENQIKYGGKTDNLLKTLNSVQHHVYEPEDYIALEVKDQTPLEAAQEFIEKAKDPEEVYRFGFIPELTMSREEAQTQDKTIVEHLNAILDFSKGRALKDDELKTVCDLVDKAFLLDCQTCENICKIGNQFEEQLIEERKPFGELYKRLLNVEKTQDRIDYVEESNIKTDKAIIDFISQDDIEGLKYLQDNGIDLSGAEAGHPMIDPYGINLFSYATTPEMVDFLAKAGCDINIPIERMCPNFVDPTNEGPYSLLCDAMDRQVPIEVISHMIKAGAKVEDDCEQVLWGYKFDAQCAQEYQTNENHSKKDFYSNLAEIERFIQKVDHTAFIEQRKKEVKNRLKEQQKAEQTKKTNEETEKFLGMFSKFDPRGK